MKRILTHLMKEPGKLNSIYALIGNLTYAILGFIGIAILARSLDLNTYGKWIIYLTASSLLEMMRQGFIHTALVRYTSDKNSLLKNQYIAGGWIIGIIFTLISTLIICGLNLIITYKGIETSYDYFLKYYPLLSIASLPFIISQSILQASSKFLTILALKTLNMIMAISVYFLSYKYTFSLDLLVLLHIIVNLITSLLTIIFKISSISKIKYFERKRFLELIHFGKYSFGTLIGTNLLKSSDTFLIGLMAGSPQAALYSIPLKLTETFEILLRSIVSVAMPKLSYFSVNNENNKVKEMFQNLSGTLTFIYLPIMICCFFLSDYLILLLGGKTFLNSSEIFKIFCVYGLILPLDRFTGITLDCINKPKYNFYKVSIMILVNVTLDLIVLYFNLPLKYVALVTFLTTLTGCYIGIKYLNKTFKTSIKEIFISGMQYSKRLRYKPIP